MHYVHWDARWDEWVARDQLRWPVPEGRTGAVASGDDVEVWCSGSAVPGASAPESLARDACAAAPALTLIPRRWLRAVVTAVEGELYCVGDVASSGRLWVRRDRVRLIQRKQDRAPRAPKRLQPCRMLFALARATTAAVRARLASR